MKKLLTIVVILIVLGGAYWLLGSPTSRPTENPSTPSVDLTQGAPVYNHPKPLITRADGSALEFPMTPVGKLYLLSDINYLTSATVRGWVESVAYDNVGGKLVITDKNGNFTEANISHAAVSQYLDILPQLKKGDEVEVFGTNIYANVGIRPYFGLVGDIKVISPANQ